MMKITYGLLKASIALLMVLATVACSVAPSSIVKTPMSARPQVGDKAPENSGGIYQASRYRPLFEDRRARMVGDILTIRIVENTKAGKAGSASASKTGSIDATVTPPTGLPIGLIKKPISISADSDLANDEDAESSASNSFSGNIAVTVIEVLENNYLVVSGEKQIAFDRGSEFVRFSGVINPDDITQGNFVSSSKVAEAKMEYRTNSQIDAAQVISILARFFLSISPI